MSEIEFLQAMGFEYQNHTAAYDIEGQLTIIPYHSITHPDVPGLFIAHKDMGKLLRTVVWAVKTLSILNELGVREVKS